MVPPDLPRCLPTADEVLVHGANGLCGAPEALRQGTPWFVGAGALALVALAGMALRTRYRRFAVLAAALVLAGASSVGYRALRVRADAPGRTAELAARTGDAARRMELLAHATTGCVRLPGGSPAGSEAVLHYASPTARLCGRRLAVGVEAPCPPGGSCPPAPPATLVH